MSTGIGEAATDAGLAQEWPLSAGNVGFEIEMSQAKLEPTTLAEAAGMYTVLISCWGVRPD